MQPQENDFTTIVKDIETHKIILPDFQREFVWRDELMQRQVVASVFAMMPIGSILLLKSKPGDFASKNIGSKIETDKSVLDKEVKFLLDGQQRLTVLANVFSNVIFEQCPKFSDLISPTLKRRFFLKIPRWKEFYEKPEKMDILGVRNFTKPTDSYGNVEFLTSDIMDYIEVKSFLSGDDKVYNPNHKLDNKLDSFCVNGSDYYLIPLYIFIPTAKNETQAPIRRKNIMEGIGKKIVDEIIDEFIGLDVRNEVDKQKPLLASILDDDTAEELINEWQSDKGSGADSIKEVLIDRSNYWTEALKDYIDLCLKNMSLNQIVVTSEQRARAIDIYENLNRGGISLSTFDLIMARVAIVSKSNFYKRLVKNINTQREYDSNKIPHDVKTVFDKRFADKSYIASVYTDCYSHENNRIEKIYIDAFLDVLSLYCNNSEYDPTVYSLDLIKRNKILSLQPEDIDKNCEKICTAIDRALFFFQARCGIRSIKEINYNLMLVFVATIFTNDGYYADIKVHEKLEAWYWSSVFSGEFDKDQNSILIKHLRNFISMLRETNSDNWIRSMADNVLAANNFSDEKLLLLEKVDEDRYPKKILRNYISQYFLARTYPDMFRGNDIICVFSKNADSLELHHIIPLGSVKSISESTSKLRNDKNHICNSPLNFVYITKDDNLTISNKSLKDYAELVTYNAKSALQITQYIDDDALKSDDKIKNLLKTRYSYIKGCIQNNIESLL